MRELVKEEIAHANTMRLSDQWIAGATRYERDLTEATDNEYQLAQTLQRSAGLQHSWVAPLYISQARAIMADVGMKQQITTLVSVSGSVPRRVFHHKKSGGDYTIVGVANLQSMVAIAEPTQLVVYRAHSDSSLWVRPHSEFFDGRFQELE